MAREKKDKTIDIVDERQENLSLVDDALKENDNTNNEEFGDLLAGDIKDENGDVNNLISADAKQKIKEIKLDENEEIISELVVKDKLEQIAKESSPSSKRKKTLSSILMLVINFTLVYFIASAFFKSGDAASFKVLIDAQGEQIKLLWWLVPIFFVVMLADSFFISIILKTSTGKFRFWLAYRTSAIGKYYEAITPLSAGGQPAQIVYLAKRKVSPGVATSVPILRVTILNLLTIIVSLLLFIFVVPSIKATNDFWSILIGFLKLLAYIGVVLNTFLVVIMFIISNSKTFGRSLARSVVKLGYKLHFIRDYRASYKKFMNQVVEYQNSLDYLKKHIGVLIGSMLSILVQILALASIPFVVSLALGSVEFASNAEVFAFYIECVAKYYVCYMASAFIPLPGGTGMMEISFIILFTSVVGSNFIVWAFLIWRIVSYYALIVQGFGLTIGDIIAGAVKRDKKKVANKAN